MGPRSRCIFCRTQWSCTASGLCRLGCIGWSPSPEAPAALPLRKLEQGLGGSEGCLVPSPGTSALLWWPMVPNIWEAGSLPRLHPETRAPASFALKLRSISLGFLIFLAHSITKHQTVAWTADIFSQFWRHHDEGACKFTFWPELSSWPADFRLLPVSSHGLSLGTADTANLLESLPLLVKAPALLD